MRNMLCQTCKRTKTAGAERERRFCSVWWTIFIQAGVHQHVTVTCNSKHWIRCVGFKDFFRRNLSVLEVLTYEMIKKTWIIPHQGCKIFGWILLNGFDVLKQFLQRLQLQWVAHILGKNRKPKKFTVEERCKKKHVFYFKTSKGEWMTH